MKKEDIAKKQLEVLRKMSGAQKVRLGAELYEMAKEIAKAGIRDRFPNLSEKKVEEKLKERLTGTFKAAKESRRFWGKI